MSEKFNSGYGAVICDHCRTMLLEGKLAGGGFKHTIRPVLIAAWFPEQDGRPSQVDFCSVGCAHAYCGGDSPEPAEKQAVCNALTAYYGRLATETM